jgi:hypothetical protein
MVEKEQHSIEEDAQNQHANSQQVFLVEEPPSKLVAEGYGCYDHGEVVGSEEGVPPVE